MVTKRMAKIIVITNHVPNREKTIKQTPIFVMETHCRQLVAYVDISTYDKQNLFSFRKVF